jgi:hypothetical protein
MRWILPLVLLAALLAAPVARAQTIRWDPPGGSLPVGEVASLQLVFEGCSPEQVPALPKVDGVHFEYLGQSSSTSLINGSFSQVLVLTFSALLSKQQEVEIPAFAVTTNKGSIHVAPARFTAAGATVGPGGVPISDAASARLEPALDSVWAGQVFDLKYTIDVAASYYPNWGHGTFEWDPTPLVAEDWSQPEPFETRDGSGRTGLSYHARALAPTAGRITLNPSSQLINLSVGVAGFGFFQQRQYQQFAVPDSPVTLEVRPLPPAPTGFSGAVGQFKVATKVVPLQVRVGEPITWTVELSGTGNWPEIRGLPSREAPADFQAIQPKPKRTQPANKLFEGTLTEDVVLVPTQPGEYDLPPVNVTYFDPQSGSYRTVSAPGAHLTIAPAPAAAGAGQTPAAPGVPAISATTAPATEAKAPDQPTGALGDPLAPADPAAPLLRRRTLVLAAAAPLALAALLWAFLAQRRSRVTDPLKAQRAARLRLAATLGAIPGAAISARAPLLLAWQRDAAVLWGVRHAAPPAASFPEPRWAALWTEADRFLYGTEASLPADWVARAQAALAGKRLPGRSPLAFLLPRNLFPVALLALALAPHLAAAPSGPYARGDFAAAEKEWSAQLAADPLNWSARHNLSLALAQQDRWGEAAAHAAGAFLQNPANPELRRQLVLTGDKAGFVPEPFDGLLQAGPVQALALLHSPATWQRIAIGSSALVAAALVLALLSSYRLVRRGWALAAALVLLLAAILGGAAALVAQHAYGIGADARAVVVWRAGLLRSIPTEADVSQKTTPLPAGGTAVADRAFLRWVRLTFPNGQTGWVLDSEVIGLWTPPPTP